MTGHADTLSRNAVYSLDDGSGTLALITDQIAMGIEGHPQHTETTRERRMVVINVTDVVIGELLKDGEVERFSPETQRALFRILKANLRGKHVVLAGEARTLSGVEVRAVEVRFADLR